MSPADLSGSEPPPLRRDAMARAWLLLRGVSRAGDQLWTVALAWTAVHVASPGAAGAVVAAGTTPRALTLLLGGVAADRYDARRVMAWTNLVRVVVLLAVLVRMLFGSPTLPVLVLAAVVFGVADAAYEPSASTISRQLVRRADLPSYAAAGETLTRLGEMAGAASGGVVVAAWGLGTSAALDALTFAAVAVFLVTRLVPRYPLERAVAEPPWRSVAGGLRHLRTTPLTRTLVLSTAGLNLFVVPAETVGLALRAQQEGWGASTVGLFLGLLGAGAALGSAVSIRWRPRREARAAFGCLAVQGLAILVLGQGPRWPTALAAGLIGVTAGVASVLLSAVFAALVDGAYLGRMTALQRLGDDVLMPLATVGFGLLAAAAGITAGLAAYGVTMTVLVGLALANPTVRRISLREPAQPILAAASRAS